MTVNDDTTGHDAPFSSGGDGAVESVNGQTGAVVFDAVDIGALPVADPAGVIVDTTTYDDFVSGSGKLTTLVFPSDVEHAAVAVAIEGEAAPRCIITSQGAVYLGTGAVDPYNEGGGSVAMSGDTLGLGSTFGRVSIGGALPATINGHATIAHAVPNIAAPTAGMDGRYVNVGGGTDVVAAYGITGEDHARLLLYSDGRMKVGDGSVDPAGLTVGPVVVQPDGTYLRVIAVDNAGTLGTESLV